jgi:hypothetical protein
MSACGTKRTNRAGLAMSVHWGSPEVAGRGAKRRDPRHRQDRPRDLDSAARGSPEASETAFRAIPEWDLPHRDRKLAFMPSGSVEVIVKRLDIPIDEAD